MAKAKNQQPDDQKQNHAIETLEQGEIFFLYRPAVDEASVKGLQDVQRFFMVLHPADSDTYRTVIIGRKKLPEPDQSGERYWGFVDEILRNEQNTEKKLKELFASEDYSTATRGERELAAMIPAGMGQYQILRHGDHTHLAYELSLPKRRSEVQQDFNIERAANYVISVKNPKASTPRGVGLEHEQKADLPQSLQEKFKARRFIDVDPPKLLDYVGVELLLISTSESMRSLGVEFDAAERDADYVFQALHLERSKEAERALAGGRWH